MRNLLTAFLAMTLLLVSCKGEQQNEKIESEETKTKNVKTYGLLFNERDSISVALNLDDYKTYEELLNRVQQIGCTDRIPKITLENDEEIRKIYFMSTCDENENAPLIKVKNLIQIHEDEVFTYFNNNYSALDSLKSITAMNIKNYGKIESLSESPDKLVFSIAYSLDANPNRLKNTLLQLTKVFDEVGGKTNLRIILDKLMIAPPPPPPTPEVIEVVEDEVQIVEVVEVEEERLAEEQAKEKLKSLPSSIQKLLKDIVYVRGGTFTMGCTSEQGNDCYSDERPIHSVRINGFIMGKYEVTQSQWQAVMGSNPSSFKGCGECPVDKVSWNDIQEFIRKLQKLTGKRFRLPTEAEWEFAARGGTRSRGYQYAGGDNLNSVAWFEDNSNQKTHPVGQKAPNELGLYDMNGNVWEWCSDWYGGYDNSPSTNPKGPSSGANRVLRGGGWDDSAEDCRVASRDYDFPSYRDNSFGFRVALSQ
jgi:formylglycine-generating enzyme required for sulfatase activity